MTPELAEQIATQETFFEPLIVEPDGVTIEADELGGVPVERTVPVGGGHPDLAIIYLHGGGYSSGLAKWARRGTARLALGTGARVVAADYRLTPQFPFPAAHEDVLAVYQHLIGPGGYAPGNIAVAGDSAGGALTVSLMADARDAGLPLPACGMINSLWADIALNTPSLDDPVRNQYDIRRRLVEVLSETFLATGGIDPYDGRHSPVYRDLKGLPPLLVQAAGRDVCHDDSVRLAASARAAGVEVTITEYPEAEHIWILNGPWRIRYGDNYPEDGIYWVDSGAEAPEAVTAIDEMCRFVQAHTGGAVGPLRPGRPHSRNPARRAYLGCSASSLFRRSVSRSWQQSPPFAVASPSRIRHRILVHPHAAPRRGPPRSAGAAMGARPTAPAVRPVGRSSVTAPRYVPPPPAYQRAQEYPASATTSLVTGVLSLFLWFGIGLVPAIIAIYSARNTPKRPDGSDHPFATAGLITGAIGALFSALFILVIGLVVVGALASSG